MNTKILTQEEKTALSKVGESLQIVDGRYQVGTPWKKVQPQLPNNRTMAITSLRCTEKNRMKNPTVGIEYQSTFEAYLKKGYLRKIDPDKELPGA